MNLSSPDSIDLKEKIRQQYDFLPYPESDIDLLPKDKLQSLFIHSLATPYYLRYQQAVDTKDKIILDAGCGSGLQSLILALANPGAKIVGVDLSPKSIELATQRFAYHGFENAEFHTLSLDEIDSLGYHFDYINCDEVLYLLPNPAEMLKIFRSILKPRGIIRSNLHSYYQRNAFFRSQEAFKFLGLLDEASGDSAIEIVKDTLDSLHDSVKLKQLLQGFENEVKPNQKQIKEWILVNYLIQGDKGYTIRELFDFLDIAELDFLSMVNWRQWEFTSLFKDLENLPFFWQLGLESATEAEKLQLFELFHPIHRLLDFWAVQKDDIPLPTSPFYWSDEQWLSCRIHLHPVLAKDNVKEDLRQAIAKRESFQISRYIPLPSIKPVIIDSLLGACLLPLWESAQSLSDLVQRWLLLQPLNPETLESKTETQAKQEIQELLTELETFTYLLLEISQ
jgi:2-polyprenyl-3-methyl-5-hydroxy-6-metoxy-1,4-benzoquinol methylase